MATLREAVRIPTVSYPREEDVDGEQFERLHALLRERFPLLHEHAELTRVGTHGLLYRWAGRSGDRPVVLMAHQDVVPVEEGDPWQRPAYGAEVVDGVLWGRGTLDDKGSLVGICAAVEELLAEGFVPAQDVWLSFGAREEVSGADAVEAVQVLRDRGVQPWFVLDEGGAVAYDAFPGVQPPLGVVGVAEKGTTTLELVARGRGGHTSTPAPNGPTARIARAIVRLERKPFPQRIPEPTLELLTRIAPHAPMPLRPVLSRARALEPALKRVLAQVGPEAAALTRSTMAVTMLQGSPAHNVIASSARATVNLRLLVGDSVASAVEHVRRVVADPDVEVEVVEANEPSPVSPMDDPAFELVTRTITEVFPDAVPTPYVMMAATDSRFFAAICPRVYRFAPFRMTKEQRESIHSFDERIGVEDFVAGVGWYRRLVEQLPADADGAS